MNSIIVMISDNDDKSLKNTKGRSLGKKKSPIVRVNTYQIKNTLSRVSDQDVAQTMNNNEHAFVNEIDPEALQKFFSNMKNWNPQNEGFLCHALLSNYSWKYKQDDKMYEHNNMGLDLDSIFAIIDANGIEQQNVSIDKMYQLLNKVHTKVMGDFNSQERGKISFGDFQKYQTNIKGTKSKNMYKKLLHNKSMTPISLLAHRYSAEPLTLIIALKGEKLSSVHYYSTVIY